MSNMVFACSQCGEDISIDDSQAGSPMECPNCSNTVLAPPPGIKAQMFVGDYKLIKCLGVGGMGEVWLAHQGTMDRNVALKLLSPALTDNEKFVSRFMQEVKISAKLQHPNIVTSFYAGVEKGIYYLAISYVDGFALNDKLEDEGMMPEAEVLDIAQKIAMALKYAWNKFKIVHRDIKPGNIMISKEDGEVHLMDMGISKNLTEDNTLTMTGMIVGTPYYMSPEQARGDDDLDCRADIYALGSTMYHMLTGEVPYDAPNAMGILTKLISEPFPPPKEKNPKITEECSQLLETMMQKNTETRQQNWEQVIKDIEKVRHGQKPTTEILPKKTAEFSEKSQTKSRTKIDQRQKESGNKPPNPTKIRKSSDNKNTVASCPSCGVNNKVDALFCVKCGGSLSRKCPECSENASILMNFCSKCGADIKTLTELEKILEQVKNEKLQSHWTKILQISSSLPEKKQLVGKKSSRFLTEIIRIKSEAEKLVHMEEAYNQANELAKNYAAEDKNIEAFNVLQNFLNEYPKCDYAPEIKHRINKFRKISYQGPDIGKEWIIPETMLNMLPISAGKFTMGSHSGNFLGMGGEKGRMSNEGPQHQVTISQPFWIAKYLMTIGDFIGFINSPDNEGEIQWTAETCSLEQAGKDKSNEISCWKDMKQPMVEINWLDASNCCKWLTQREIKNNRLPDGYLYRLPTEAEWEYCCRAGTTTAFFFGNSDTMINEYAWCKNNSHHQTHPVGEKKPNPWGLYDMHGNVWEWCQDKYGDYLDDPVTDPYGSSAGIGYVRRGGSWINNSGHCRSAYRNFWEAKCAFNYLGFRIVLAPAKIRMFGTQF